MLDFLDLMFHGFLDFYTHLFAVDTFVAFFFIFLFWNLFRCVRF